MITLTLMLLLFVLGCLAAWLLLGPEANQEPVHRTRLKTDQKLSVIVPARNEEDNIQILVRSLLKGSRPPDEIIVVDDGSTDRTAEVAQTEGASVIQSTALPEGWTGKNWACFQGATSANGELFLFLDADTEFMPDGVDLLLSRFETITIPSALSVLPHHRMKTNLEHLSLIFNLLMAMGVEAFSRLRDNRTKLVGQCLLISKEDYFRSGGHLAVKGRVLENFHLSEVLRSHEITPLTILGQGIVSVRLFSRGFFQLVEGFSKSFKLGARFTSARTLIATFFWMSAMVMPLFIAIDGYAALALGAYAVMSFQIYFLSRRIGAFRPIDAVCYPIPLAFYLCTSAYALLQSYLGIQATWRGRAITEG